MGKNLPRICGICGEEETSGWTSHKQRNHNGQAVELVVGQYPNEPKHADWFDKLSREMQLKYAISKLAMTKDILNEANQLRDEKDLSEQKTDFSVSNFKFSFNRSNLTSQEVSPERTGSQLPSRTIGSAFDADGLVVRKLFGQIDELKIENQKLKGQLKGVKWTMDIHTNCNKLIDELKKQLLEAEDLVARLRIQRDELAAALGKKVGAVMDEHMNNVNISKSSLQSNNDSSHDGFDLSITQTNNEDQQMQITTNEEEEKKDSDVKFTQQNFAHKSEGYMRWVDGELVTVTQSIVENALIVDKMKEFRFRCTSCKKILSCEAGWKAHTEWMANCGKTCVCDVFSFAKYSHSLKGTSGQHFQRDIEEKELNKLETLIAATMEKPELIVPEKFKSALETRRDIQRDESIRFIISKKNQLATVEEWLVSISQQSQQSELEQLGGPICDGIVYPRCPIVFGENIKHHDEQLEVFLKTHSIPVRSVGNVATNDKNSAFVYLTDSDNTFNQELI